MKRFILILVLASAFLVPQQAKSFSQCEHTCNVITICELYDYMLGLQYYPGTFDTWVAVGSCRYYDTSVPTCPIVAIYSIPFFATYCSEEPTWMEGAKYPGSLSCIQFYCE